MLKEKEKDLAKIGELEQAIIGDEKISGFQIPMYDHIPVTDVKARENLEHPSLELGDSNRTALLLGLIDHRCQVSPQVLRDKHKVLVFPPKELMENDDVRGVEDLSAPPPRCPTADGSCFYSV